MSKASERREMLRQRFIETTLAHMEAMTVEVVADPGFLSADQLGRLQVRMETLRRALAKKTR
jgi:hypothetical protein